MTHPNQLSVFHLRTSVLIGGVETVLGDWVQHFGTEGIHSRLCCFRNSSGSEQAFIDYLDQHAIPVTMVPWGRRKSLLAAVRMLVSEIKATQGPVVINSHDVRARLVANVVAFRTKIPHIASMHAWHNVPGKVRFLEAIDARLLRHVDILVNCSEATRQGSIARGIAPEKTTTIYNGLDFAPFQIPTDRLAWRRRYGLNPDDYVVGNVARLYPEKGQINLLEAAAMLRAKFPRLRIIIFGDGPERAGLEAARQNLNLTDIVSMPGFEPDFPGMLSMFDAFALPSLAEGTPQVIIGAMARALPIVACPVDGVAEALRDNVSALFVPPGNSAALANAIEKLMNQPELARRLAQQAHADGLSRFAVSATARQYAEVYRRLLAESARS